MNPRPPLRTPGAVPLVLIPDVLSGQWTLKSSVSITILRCLHVDLLQFSVLSSEVPTGAAVWSSCPVAVQVVTVHCTRCWVGFSFRPEASGEDPPFGRPGAGGESRVCKQVESFHGGLRPRRDLCVYQQAVVLDRLTEKRDVGFGNLRKLKILLIKMSIIQSVFRKPVFLVGKDGLNKTTVCSLGCVYVFGPFAQQETPNVFAVKALSSPGTQRSKPGAEAGRREGVTPQEPPRSQSAHRHSRGHCHLHKSGAAVSLAPD